MTADLLNLLYTCSIDTPLRHPEVLKLVVFRYEVFELFHIVEWHVLQQLVEFLQQFSFPGTPKDFPTGP